MNIHFTDDEMSDFLLARGYLIRVQSEEVENNIYQNVFETSVEIKVSATKDGTIFQPLLKAFEKEFKHKLLNNK